MIKVTTKRYGCTHCGAISQEETNHYGEIYSRCKECSWNRPGNPTVKVCIDPVPKDGWIPEPWHFVQVKDIAEIKSA